MVPVLPGYFRAGSDGAFAPATAMGRSLLYPVLCDSWTNDFTPFPACDETFGAADPAGAGEVFWTEVPVVFVSWVGVVVKIVQLLSCFF